MEEVDGSSPFGPTIFFNKLGTVGGDSCEICVIVCVITRLFGARGECFKGCPLRFHSDVAVPFQHASADVPGNGHDG